MKRYFLLLLFMPAMICGMRERSYSIEDKSMLRLCVKNLRPDIQQAEQLKKIAAIKKIEWERDFNNALESDDLAKLRPLVEVGFFTLQEEYLWYAYNHQKIDIMRYFLGLKIQDHEKKSLAEKSKTKFFSFKAHGEEPQGQDPHFNLFFKTFEHYFWKMRYIRNYQESDIQQQIKDHNAVCFIFNEKIAYDPNYVATCSKYIQDYFRRASNQTREYIIMCAQMFDHKQVLKKLTFFEFISDLLHENLADVLVYTEH